MLDLIALQPTTQASNPSACEQHSPSAPPEQQEEDKRPAGVQEAWCHQC